MSSGKNIAVLPLQSPTDDSLSNLSRHGLKLSLINNSKGQINNSDGTDDEAEASTPAF